MLYINWWLHQIREVIDLLEVHVFFLRILEFLWNTVWNKTLASGLISGFCGLDLAHQLIASSSRLPQQGSAWVQTLLAPSRGSPHYTPTVTHPVPTDSATPTPALASVRSFLAGLLSLLLQPPGYCSAPAAPPSPAPAMPHQVGGWDRMGNWSWAVPAPARGAPAPGHLPPLCLPGAISSHQQTAERVKGGWELEPHVLGQEL